MCLDFADTIDVLANEGAVFQLAALQKPRFQEQLRPGPARFHATHRKSLNVTENAVSLHNLKHIMKP